jgi:hypothetical protein
LPPVRTIKVVGHHDGKTVINLLNTKPHIVMEVDVWQSGAGDWKAGRWSQCID